jgi:lysophospholipase L1-like esterase
MTTLFATVQNRINNATDNGGSTVNGVGGATAAEARLGWGRRFHHTIGSGAVDKFRLSYDNWRGEASNNQEFNTGNSFTITAGHVEFNGIIVPILFSGNRSITVADGEAEILSDWIYPAQFSVAQFARGDTFWTKEHGTVPGPTPATNGKLPTSYRQIADFTGCQMFFYAAGQTTISAVDISGMFTSTGATRHERASGACPIVIGTYVGGDKAVRMAIGDSMTQGTGDGTAFKHGRGSFQRAMVDADGVSNPVSSANFAVHGSAATLAVQGQKMRNYSKYCNSIMINYGTNDFSLTGGSISVAGMMTRVNNIRSAYTVINPTARFGIHALGPRNNSTDSWATLANQTTLTNWGAGGNPDLYNQGLASAGYDVVFPNTAVRSATDYHKFEVSGAANFMAYDNTHYSTNGYTVTATQDRPLFATLDPTFGGSDTTPDAFSFTAVTDVALSTMSTSNTITVAGTDAAATISIVDGEYQIAGGSWVTSAGTITNGQTVAVRRLSSASNSTAVTTTLTIGGVSGVYTITTVGSTDTVPDAFVFTPVTDAVKSTLTTSNSITVAGINAAATITVANGEYSIGGGSWVSTSGTVTNGQTVRVRRTSSASDGTAVTATVTIGGVSGIFTVTTAVAIVISPAPYLITDDVRAWACTGTSDVLTFTLRAGEAPKGVQFEAKNMALTGAVVTMHGVTGATKTVPIPGSPGEMLLIGLEGYRVNKITVTNIATGTYQVKLTPL